MKKLWDLLIIAISVGVGIWIAKTVLQDDKGMGSGKIVDTVVEDFGPKWDSEKMPEPTAPAL